MFFMLRQIQEKCREQNASLHVAFIDLTKAFDTVRRDGMWKILAHFGCPSNFINIVSQLHKGQQGQMKHNGSLSDSFPISNSVRKGWVLAPTLFFILFSIMLHGAKEDLPDGIFIRFRKDDSLFNLRRLLARTKTIEELIIELRFADDSALLAHTEETLQHIINRFSDAAKTFGLTISLKKTELLYQTPPREAYSPPHISIDGTNPNAVEHLTYVGSVISSDATVSKDLDNLDQSKQMRLIERFHLRCLRSTLGIKWQDYVSNEEVLKRASLPSIESILLQVQLYWTGHVTRMEGVRLPRTVFLKLQEGKRAVVLQERVT